MVIHCDHWQSEDRFVSSDYPQQALLWLGFELWHHTFVLSVAGAILRSAASCRIDVEE
jgi:hypothetical protein